MADIQYLYGNEVASESAPMTQVYKATHDGTGKRLSYRHRSFISFTYGGKSIEDFGLIAVTDGDRIERSAYAKFEDVVETYDALDGQIYWGTHLNGNELILKLATDGINSRQLDDFKQWFAPGQTRELILAEHPNRAIMARVSESPQISMMPFGEEKKVKISGKEYSTEITLFKGEITLTFAMDDPLWYAKHNLILPFIAYEGANGVIDVKDNPYRLKKLLMDNYEKARLFIKYRSSGRDNEIVGQIVEKSIQLLSFEVTQTGYWYLTGKLPNDDSITLYYPDDIISIHGGVITLASEDNSKDYAKIILEDNIPHLAMVQDTMLLGEEIAAAASKAEGLIFNNNNHEVNGMDPWTGAHIKYYGFVNSNIEMWPENLQIDSTNHQYLFYSGTAPSKPTLQFTFTPTFNEDNYINCPRNMYSHPNEVKEGNYNYIAFDDNYFKFSTPSLLTGYNQALAIVRSFPNGTAIIEIINSLKENINEYYARAWAIFAMRNLEEEYPNKTDNFVNVFIYFMKYFICSDGINPNPVTCFFNSKTGEATAQFTFRIGNGNSKEIIRLSDIPEVLKEENVGDMVKSDYLIIDGRCYPNFNGYITKKECHIVTTDFPSTNPLSNFVLHFQNMYY